VHAVRALLLWLLVLPASAQDFPSRPLRVVVPYNAGHSWDTQVRLIAAHLVRALGQPVIVENRPGASGTLGAAAVARANADGYTVLAGGVADQAVAPAVMELPYDPRASFAPVTMAVRGYAILVARPGLASDMKQLLSLAKTRNLAVGTQGEASLTHLMALQLRDLAGADMTIVPYKSATDGLSDAMGGRIDLWFDFVPAVAQYVQAGRLRALMVAGERRMAALPGVPNAAEAGLAPLRHASWGGFLVPAGTPPAVVGRLHGALTSALRSPEFLANAARYSFEVVADSPEEFSAFIREQREALGRLAAATGVRVK
jgi:tripartite-type tricarboxylate transporter receptor subunit TctC